jgi:adenine-specific DNA-methyltransferase
MAQVEEALHEARGGYDAVILCGFSFQPEAQALIGRQKDNRFLKAFMAHIRPDVVLTDGRGESLLRTPANSQLFAVFGEPDVALAGPDEEGAYGVTLNGVDVYDPLTGRVESARPTQIGAWFLDTDYDGRTFCICQAFFPNVNAWDKIARALRGRLDEERLDLLSGTESLPFKPGQHRRVAVKVIDQRGNEVMRVLSLAASGSLTYATAEA